MHAIRRCRTFVPRVVLLLLVGSTACVGRVVRTVGHRVDVPRLDSAGATLSEPLKAQLRDGSIVTFGNGATIGRGAVRGTGVKYAMFADGGAPIDSVAVGDVVGIAALRGPIVRTGSFGEVLVAAIVSGSRRAAGLPRCESRSRSPLAMRRRTD